MLHTIALCEAPCLGLKGSIICNSVVNEIWKMPAQETEHHVVPNGMAPVYGSSITIRVYKNVCVYASMTQGHNTNTYSNYFLSKNVGII